MEDSNRTDVYNSESITLPTLGVFIKTEPEDSDTPDFERVKIKDELIWDSNNVWEAKDHGNTCGCLKLKHEERWLHTGYCRCNSCASLLAIDTGILPVIYDHDYGRKSDLVCKICQALDPYETYSEMFYCNICKQLVNKIGMAHACKPHTGINNSPVYESVIINNREGIDRKICKAVLKIHKMNSEKRQQTCEKSLKCKICEKSFSKELDHYLHERGHIKCRPIFCKYCDRIFFNELEFSAHKHEHDVNRPLLCEYCKQSFISVYGVKSHVCKVRMCEYCNKGFSNQIKLENHERTHTGEKPYSCKYCEKSFADKIAARIHERIHIRKKPFNEKPLICKYCSKVFLDKSLLQHHEKLQCTFKFMNRKVDSELTTTSSIEPSNEKPLICKYCSKVFLDKSLLQHHEQIQCTFNFVNCKVDSQLTTTSSIEPSNEEPLICKYCSKGFLYKYVLIHHEKTQCNRKFIIDSQLKSMSSFRLPNGGPFICTECGEEFLYKSLLKRHEKIQCIINIKNHKFTIDSHSRSKSIDMGPFICENCGQVFLYKWALERHARRHGLARYGNFTIYDKFVVNSYLKKI